MSFFEPFTGSTFVPVSINNLKMNKGSRLYSIMHNKCPKCQEGDFFISKTYNLGSFSKMNDECPVCKESFEPEPGFYFGAMFVSYAINVAIMVAVWVASNVLIKEEVGVWWLVLASVVTGLVLTPVTFRWARLVWINMFVKYDPNSARKASSNILRATSR